MKLMELGEILRARRKAKGLTLRQLSENCNISVVHLSNIERGKKDPGYRLLEKIANSYNLGVADMLKSPVFGLTDIDLMNNCLDDAGVILEKAFRYSELGISDQFHCLVPIAIELFNFRTDRAGSRIEATNIPEDDIPF